MTASLALGSIPSAPAVQEVLLAGAKALVGRLGASSWHVALPTDEEAEWLQGEDLLLSHDVLFHWLDPGWSDFDGYLASFRRIRNPTAPPRVHESSSSSVNVEFGPGSP